MNYFLTYQHIYPNYHYIINIFNNYLNGHIFLNINFTKINPLLSYHIYPTSLTKPTMALLGKLTTLFIKQSNPAYTPNFSIAKLNLEE